VAIFTAFSDESGTGDPAGVYLVGGYIAIEDRWGGYADAWAENVLDPNPPIPDLHMRKIRREKFQKEHHLTSEEADRKVSKATTLLASIASHSHPGTPAMHAVLSIVKRADLWDMIDLVKSKGHKVQSGSMDMPDYLCFMAYVNVAIDYTFRMFNDLDRIDFVVSNNGKITRHFDTYLKGIKARHSQPRLFGDLIPGNPILRNPLQMADVLCWHWRRYYESGITDENMERLMQIRTFPHEWKRDKLEALTRGLAARLRQIDEREG
jgi:hypothetical protein